MNNNLLFHIGYHKTATTWLQRQLFIKNSPIFLPVSENEEGASTVAKHFYQDKNAYLLSSFDLNKENIVKAIQTFFEADKIGERLPIISHERLSGSPHAGGFDARLIADRIKNACPYGRIFISIRQQHDVIFSLYFQYLRMGGTHSLHEYLSTPYDGKRPHFSPNYLEYHQLVSYYIDLFGEENVLVLPYELFISDAKNYVHQLLEFCRLKLDLNSLDYSWKTNQLEGNLLAEYKSRFLNKKLRKNSLNDYGPKQKSWDEVYVKTLKSLYSSANAKRKNQEFIQQKRQEIIDWSNNRFINGNKHLASLINVDLSKYNYY